MAWSDSRKVAMWWEGGHRREQSQPRLARSRQGKMGARCHRTSEVTGEALACTGARGKPFEGFEQRMTCSDHGYKNTTLAAVLRID